MLLVCYIPPLLKSCPYSRDTSLSTMSVVLVCETPNVIVGPACRCHPGGCSSGRADQQSQLFCEGVAQIIAGQWEFVVVNTQIPPCFVRGFDRALTTKVLLLIPALCVFSCTGSDRWLTAASREFLHLVSATAGIAVGTNKQHQDPR